MDSAISPETQNNGPFYPLAGITTTAAIPSTRQFENLKQNIKLGLPKLKNLPEFHKVKGFEIPIALVGGGPDIVNQLDELRKFRTIVACGSVHDFLIKNNIVPTYAVMCDPDPVGLNYFKTPHTEVKYLLSSGCDPLIIEHFSSYQRILWHCHSDDYLDEKLNFNIKEVDSDYDAIGGGCTVGLRSVSIALCMGYSNIHFFGYDSCLGSDKSGYAYDLSTQKEKEDMGKIYAVKKGFVDKGSDGDTYYCLGYHIAQLEHFKGFWAAHHEYFVPTFHGKGLMPDFINMIQKVRRDQEAVERVTTNG
jgi:hypothetical protein